MEEKKVKLELVQYPYSKSGPTLYLDDEKIAGPKAFGVGKTIYSFEVDATLLRTLVDDRLPRIWLDEDVIIKGYIGYDERFTLSAKCPINTWIARTKNDDEVKEKIRDYYTFPGETLTCQIERWDPILAKNDMFNGGALRLAMFFTYDYREAAFYEVAAKKTIVVEFNRVDKMIFKDDETIEFTFTKV